MTKNNKKCRRLPIKPDLVQNSKCFIDVFTVFTLMFSQESENMGVDVQMKSHWL
jgi:hypothetical protein